MPFQPSGRPYSAGAQWGGILGNATAGLGEGVGKGIQQGLDFLAHEKMLHMQGQHASRQRERERQEVARGYERDFGKESAMNLAYRSPKEREILLSNPEYVQYLQSIRNQGNAENGINALTAQQPNRQQEIARMAQESGITPEQIAQILNPMGRQTSPEAQQMAQARDMQQPAQQQQPSAQFLANAYTPEATKIQREKLGLQRLSTFLPTFKEIEKEGKSARTLKHATEQALEVFNRKKAITGPGGKFTPAYLQTADGQILNSKLQQIVLYRSQQGKGIPHKARLLLEEGTKAAIWQDPKAIEEILNDQLNDPEMNRDISKDTARRELSQQYGKNIPDDILTEIDAKSDEILKQERSKKSASFTLESLNRKFPPKKEGDRARNPATGEVQYEVRNGKWEPI